MVFMTMNESRDFPHQPGSYTGFEWVEITCHPMVMGDVCVCMYVCVCVCMHVCVYVCVYMYVCVCA